MDYKLDQIINLMNECFLDEGSFDEFIIGSFLPIYNKLQNIAPLSKKISTFVRNVHINREIPELLEKIKEKNPRVYEEYAPKIFPPPVRLPQNESPPAPLTPLSESNKADNSSSEEKRIYDILILSANPQTTQKLQLEEECKLIRTEAKNYTLKVKSDARIEDLSKYLGESDPIILHFSGHGNSKGEIILNNRESQEMVLSLEELANYLSKSRVECVLLNACFSGDKVDALIPSVSCVIGMSKEIDDKSALRFAEGFYRGIGQGKSYQESFELGRSQIKLLQLSDSDVPHFIPRDASVINLKPTRNRSTSTPPPAQNHFPSYPLWFATNRKPVDANDISQGFSGERDNQLHYGTCDVIVPKSHKIGAIGAPPWQNLLKFKLTDDRLKLQSDSLKAFEENQFWSDVQESLQKDDSNERYPLIFIHGFNVSFEAAALRAAQLGYDLKIPPGMMAFYSWPSKGKLKGYTADEATIQASEKYIYQFLMDWVQKTEVQKVHIIAHSMGNRGLLRVMQRIFARVQTESELSFGQIFLAAPDVDPDLFEDLAEAYRKLAERTTLYVSSKDRALQSSGIVHDYPRLGFCGSPEEITVVEGIDTIEVSNIDLTWLGHGYYGDARDLLQDIYHLLTEDKHPDKRFGLQPATVRNQKYWIIRK